MDIDGIGEFGEKNDSDRNANRWVGGDRLDQKEWCALSQKFVDRNTSEWRRLQCVAQQNGEHFENSFDLLPPPL